MTGSPPKPAELTRSAKIWRRTRVGVTLAMVTGLALWAASRPGGEWLALGIGAVLSLLGLYEVHRMRPLGPRLSALFVAPAVGLLVWHHALSFTQFGGTGWRALGGQALVGLAGGAIALLGFLSASRAAVGRGAPGPLAWGPLALALWIAVPLTGLGHVRFALGSQVLIALLVLSKIGDIAGYYVGNALGKRHPFPRLSPGKTWAGCVGSFVAGVAAGVFVQWLGWLGEPHFGWASGILVGAAINLAAQAGDLLESFLKRKGGVKDSGTLFGPSGGVLDLTDSLLLTVPVAIVVIPLAFHVALPA